MLVRTPINGSRARHPRQGFPVVVLSPMRDKLLLFRVYAYIYDVFALRVVRGVRLLLVQRATFHLKYIFNP